MTGASTPQIPVTVIGGYLGAGKTTLVNHLLRNAGGKRLAVLVNEFGELPIDADLIESQDDNVINIAGGCVCCSYGSDLMAALLDLLELDIQPDHLLIEASGVALPVAIAQSVTLVARFVIDGIVVLADAETVRQHGTDKYLQDTISRQLAAADIVLLNKVDLLDAAGLSETKNWIASVAPKGRIFETANAEISQAALLGLGLEFGPDAEPGSDGGLHTHHDAKVFRIDNPIDPEHLAGQLAAPELELVRAKGFVSAPDGKVFAVQTVGRRWSVQEAPAEVNALGSIVCISHNRPVDEQAVKRALSG